VLKLAVLLAARAAPALAAGEKDGGGTKRRRSRLPEYQGDDEVPRLLPKVAAQERCLGGWRYNWRNTGAGGICVEPDGCVWRRLDEGFKESDQYQVSQRMYNPAFTAYMSRFLINYEDTRGLGFWQYRQSAIDPDFTPEQIDEFMKKTLAEYTTSLSYGLAAFAGKNGPEKLLGRFYKLYGKNREQRKQLAIMFSLMDDEVQPKEALAELISIDNPTFLAEQLRKRINNAAEQKNHPSKPTVGNAANAAAVTTATSSVTDRDGGNGYGGNGQGHPEVTEVFTATSLPMLLNTEETTMVMTDTGRFRINKAQINPKHRFLLAEPTNIYKSYNPVSRERRLNWAIYLMFSLAGLVGCTTTHSVLVPLDVVKTRMQTNPKRYPSIAGGAARIYQEEGWNSLLLGAGPTFFGYSWYGLTVYPGYEFLKRALISLAGEVNGERFHVPLVLLSGALATIVACIGVAPAEAARIRIVAQPTYANNFFGTLQRISREEGPESLFKGFGPLAVRQVLFGMMKFFIFDSFADQVFRTFPQLGDSVTSQLFVSLLAGAVAGLAASVVSQPADTVLSKMKQEGGISAEKAIRDLVTKFGPAGLFLGLPSRCLWATPIIAGQFFLYDVFKNTLQVAADDLNLFFDVLAAPGDFIIV